MSNKITGIEGRPVKVGGEHSVERCKGASSSGSAAGTPGSAASAEVTLTGSAVQLANLEKALAQVPEVDPRRVEQLRSAIESGNYQVDADRVARKLVDMERALASVEPGKR